MTQDQLVTLGAVFATTALLTGSLAALVFSRLTPTRRRLEQLVSPRARGTAPVVLKTLALTDQVGPAIARVAKMLPTSPKTMSRIRRRLARAGYDNHTATVIYAASEVVVPLAVGFLVFGAMKSSRGLLAASLAAIVGYLAPGFFLARLVTKRQRQIRNGLPDALDLLIVCIEAGLALDQAILKVSEELAISHPALAEELQTVNNEVRAGKPRMEAFRNFADRTKVEDVRALVAMLIQTDRFGTSIAQALRIHADTARTTRRQHAEERAAKLGVKLVFPLVFCLFPAMYVVTVGPGAIRILRILVLGVAGQP
ncbi:MAG: type II secretion system F family protein [Hansschlegelia sp.]